MRSRAAVLARPKALVSQAKPHHPAIAVLPHSTTTATATAATSGQQTDHHLFSLYFHLLDSSPDPRHLRHLHGRLLRNNLYSDVVLTTKLLLAYSRRHRLLPSALSLFLHMPHRNSHSWNTIITELSRSALPQRSLDLFRSMRSSGVPVDEFNLPTVLRSCAALGSVPTATSLHALAVSTGLERNLFVSSSLVFCYSGLSLVSHARLLFDEMPQRDTVLWTSMLSGYAQNGEPESALAVCRDMVDDGIELDEVIGVSLLLACGQLGWLRHGRSVHGLSVRTCLGLRLNFGNALVDMYVKCGAFLCAERVFDRMPDRDVISWSALILCHGLNGHPDAALQLFEEMHAEGVEPNAITFLGVLSACAHAGMVERAWDLMDMMKQCKVEPELKHYACMVDVLGRAGRVEEAEKFVEEMPMEPDEAVLGALLAGCRVHGNVEVGERVSKKLFQMRPDKSGYYVILANIYSDAGRFDAAERVRDFMKQMNVGKLAGCSSIELDGVSSLSLPT